MKKELHPGVIITIIVLVVGAAIGFFVMGTSAPSKKVDVKTLDPQSLRDPEPLKPGQPGYKARTTDPD